MFKIGRLALRNGELNWKNYKENAAGTERGKDAFSATRFSQATDFSKAMIGSVHRKNLSVVTPSIAKTKNSRASIHSTASFNFHTSNPNP